MDFDQILVSRPNGSTAEVEQTAEGVRITLRAGAYERRMSAVIVLPWLVIWAGIAVGGLGLALSSFGVRASWVSWVAEWMPGVRILEPPGTWLTGLLLALWLLWLLIGGATVDFLMRLLRGRDLFIRDADGWRCEWQGGWWKKQCALAGGDVQSIWLDARQQKPDLIARIHGKARSLTSFGKVSDRRWLHDLLRSSLGLNAVTEPPLGPQTAALRRRQLARLTSGALPTGWRVEPMSEGGVCVHVPFGRALSIVGWGAQLTLIALVGWIWWSAHQRVQDSWVALLTEGSVPLFTALYLLMAVQAVWRRLTRLEWRVQQGQLGIHGSLLRRGPTRVYSGAELLLAREEAAGDGEELWTVSIREGTSRDSLFTGRKSDAMALAGLLAQKTGWTIEEPAVGPRV